MTDQESLLRGVLAEPDEAAPRQVYADWLDEHGMADLARLVRIEVDLERASVRGGAERERLSAEREKLRKSCVAALPVSPGLRKKAEFSFSGGVLSVEPKEGAALTPAHFRELAGLVCLRRLVRFERLTTEQLALLPLCPNVQDLKYSDWSAGRALTPEDWQVLIGLTHVERMELGGLSADFGDAETVHLAAMTWLKAIDLTFAKVTDAGLANLAAIRGLEELHLCSGDDPGVSDAGAKTLSSLRRLRVLDLMEQSLLTDAGLQHLSTLKDLTYLDIGRTSVQDPMPVIVKLKKLRFLGLQNLPVGDNDLAHLAKRLPALRELDLRGTSVTRFRLARLLPKTKWRKVRLEADMGGRYEKREVEAFEEFCREHDVVAQVEWE